MKVEKQKIEKMYHIKNLNLKITKLVCKDLSLKTK